MTYGFSDMEVGVNFIEFGVGLSGGKYGARKFMGRPFLVVRFCGSTSENSREILR